MGLSIGTSVGALVAERVSRSRVFERLGIDYCCNGRTPLGDAARARGLDPEDVVAELETADRACATADETDYAAMSASALADHVESTHHAFLRAEMPRISQLLEKVVSAHAAGHPEITEVERTFAELRQELESHLLKEERILFPLVRQLEAAGEPFAVHCGTVGNPIRVMEHEHESAGSALARLSALTKGYQPPADACATYTAALDALKLFEADMHQHIHKENNILFPRAVALQEALSR